jgi:hypothetical protein
MRTMRNTASSFLLLLSFLTLFHYVLAVSSGPSAPSSPSTPSLSAPVASPSASGTKVYLVIIHPDTASNVAAAQIQDTLGTDALKNHYPFINGMAITVSSESTADDIASAVGGQVIVSPSKVV